MPFPTRPLIPVMLLCALAGAASADSLEQALSDAYANNARIAADRFQLQATDEGVAEAKAGWRPSVAVSASIARQHQYFGFNLPGSRSVSNITPRSTVLTIDQPLYRAGGVDAAIDAAERSADAGEADLAGTEQRALLAAATAYLDCYRDQSVVALNANLVGVLTLNRHDVQVTYDAGGATETDTAQAAARLAGAVAGQAAAEADRRSAEARFRAVVGRDPGALSPPRALGAVPGSVADAQALARAQSPVVAAARHRREAADRQVDRTLADLWPRLDAVAELAHDDDELIRGVKQNSASVGVQASIPLFADGGITYARIRAARDAVKAADQLVVDAERQTEAEISAAWNALDAARAQLTQYRAAITANEVALRDTRKEVTVGTRTRLDTLNAEQELFASRVALTRAEHDALVATFRLETAIGAFTPQALGLAVEPYDPARYRDASRDQWWGTTPP